ncbi:MAG: glycosyltransferase [Peptococcaceae bacterium]|nr:glycosyltransferase [Peptococcaceae bacterium]
MRAAAALEAAFREDDPACRVIILDTFKYTSPFLEKLVLGTYMEMLKHAPAVYGYIYSRSEKGRVLSGCAKTEFSRLLGMFSARRLLDYIKRHNPEAVICTHPFPLGVLSAIRESGEYGCFTVGTVTDFIIHPFWVFPEVDLYLVGAEQLAGDLAGCGIPAERVHATGIPIDPVFSAPVDRWSVLAGYGLDPRLATILIMGGGLGMGPLPESVKALGNLGRRCQIIAVAGNNNQLREKIDRMAPELANPVRVLGYVDNVHELMASSDILVSKAGGLSCAEALAAGIPIFILDPLPGQEQRNSRFLTSAGAAVEAGGVEDLAKKIDCCLARPYLLKEMSGAASRLARPDAARTAARLIRDRAKDYRAAVAGEGPH